MAIDFNRAGRSSYASEEMEELQNFRGDQHFTTKRLSATNRNQKNYSLDNGPVGLCLPMSSRRNFPKLPLLNLFKTKVAASEYPAAESG